MIKSRSASPVWAGILTGLLTGLAQGQTISPEFATKYALSLLGQTPQSQASFVFNPTNPDQALFPPGDDGRVQTLVIERDASGHMTGTGTQPAILGAPAVSLSESIEPAYWLGSGPGGVTFFKAGFDTPTLGQISAANPPVIYRQKLADLGVGGCCYATYGKPAVSPAGFPGAGRLKFTAGRHWWDAALSPRGDGTFNVTLGASVELDPEEEDLGAFVFLPAGLPLVPKASVLIFNHGDLHIYELSANGDPIPATRRLVASGIVDIADIDPRTGDLIVYTGDPRHFYALRVATQQPPAVQVTSPVGDTTAFVGEAVCFSGTASQPDGVLTKYQLLEDNVPVDSSTGPFNNFNIYLCSPTATVPGIHTYQVVVTSAGGLTARSPEFHVTYMINPGTTPQAELTVAEPDRVRLHCESVRVFTLGMDIDDGVAERTLLVDGVVLASPLTDTATLTLRELGIGSHELIWRVKNQRGGIATVRRTIQVAAPALNRVSGDFGYDNHFHLCFTGVDGAVYVAESSAPAEPLTWQSLGQKTAAGPLLWVDTSSSVSASPRLYRVRRVP